MQTVLIPPISDAGPNGYTPSPAGPHCLNVQDEPHDGDASILSTALGTREVYGLDVSAIPDGSIIVSLRIRSAQKQSTAGGNTYRVGFIISGLDYFQPNHVLGSGSSYLVANDEVPVDPTDAAIWTKGRIARALLVHEQVAQAQGLPRPRLTELVVLADIIPPVSRPGAGGSSLAPRGSGSGLGPGASGTSLSPHRTARPLVPAFTAASRATHASGTGHAPAAVGRSLSSRPVTIVTRSGLRVSAQSLAPAVDAQSLVPSVTGAALANRKGGV